MIKLHYSDFCFLLSAFCFLLSASIQELFFSIPDHKIERSNKAMGPRIKVERWDGKLVKVRRGRKKNSKNKSQKNGMQHPRPQDGY